MTLGGKVSGSREHFVTTVHIFVTASDVARAYDVTTSTSSCF